MLLQVAPYIGYFASFMLMLALMAKSDLRFRYYGIAGNVFFIVYALMVQAYPVLLTNAILLAINAYYCFKLLNAKEDFELLEFTADEKIIEKFLSFHQTDIENYFPKFTKQQLEGNFNFMVLRNLVIANIFSAKIYEDGKAEVMINYTVPKYRDFKIGTFLFEKEKNYLLQKGINYLWYPSIENKNHAIFLSKMGFKNTAEGCIKMLHQPNATV